MYGNELAHPAFKYGKRQKGRIVQEHLCNIFCRTKSLFVFTFICIPLVFSEVLHSFPTSLTCKSGLNVRQGKESQGFSTVIEVGGERSSLCLHLRGRRSLERQRKSIPTHFPVIHRFQLPTHLLVQADIREHR